MNCLKIPSNDWSSPALAISVAIHLWIFMDPAQATLPEAVITADEEMLLENNIAIARKNARVQKGNDVLRAQTLRYDTVNQHATAEGTVRLFSDGRLYAGDRLDFKPQSNNLNSNAFRFLQGDITLEGARLETLPDGNNSYFYRVYNGSLSPDNLNKPTFRMRSQTIDYYPQKRIVLRNTTFYAGDVPFFWWPIYSQSLKSNENNFNVDVGSDRLQGLFLKTQYAYAITPDLTARALFDMRSRRGLAGGSLISWTPSDAVYARFRAYYAQDNAPDYNQYSLPRASTSASRHIFSFQQRYEAWHKLTITSDLNRWSDPHVTEDFFRREYRHLPQPDHFVEILWTEPSLSLSLLNRFSTHPFFQTVERTPELRLDVKRHPLFSSGISYESQSSLARLRFHHARDSHSHYHDYATWRLDTLQQLVYPLKLWDAVQIIPRVALRATHWTNLHPIEDTTFSHSDKTRLAAIFGIDISSKLHRTWKEFQSPSLRLDGLRHIIEPYLSIQYIPNPLAEIDRYHAWDRRLPNQNITTINPLLDSSVDDLTQELRFVPGIRQKWQTRRDGQTFTWLEWNLYTDVNPLRLYNEEQRPDRRALGNLHSRIAFSPYPWLRFDSWLSIPCVRENYTEANTQLSWQLHPAVHFAVGHYYLQKSVLFPSSNLVYLKTFYRINESWQIGAEHRFEAADGRLESMRYSIYRDFTSWQCSLSYEGTANRGRSFEHAIYLGFTLKAFPEINYRMTQ